MGLYIEHTNDGPRNHIVQVTGAGPLEHVVVADIGQFVPKPDEVRLSEVFFVIGAETEVTLFWEDEDEHIPFLPLSGRGRIDFNSVSGIKNVASNKTGSIVLTCTGTGPFLIVLDLSKHVKG